LKLSSETLLDHKEVQRINNRLLSETLTFDEQYSDIKAHEAQLQNYSHKLPAESLSETEESVLTELLNAARDASYSAKSLKDIKENLVNLRYQVGTQKLIRQIDSRILSFYPKLTALLEKPANDWPDDTASTAKSALTHAHDSLHQQMIDYLHSQHGEITLPTLFNINREIYVSNQSLLDAVLTLSTYKQLPGNCL
jgi:phosphate:Na+ symporter